MIDDSLSFAPIAQLSALFEKRKISPVELMELFLRRIERYNPKLNAYLTVTTERALEDALRAERVFLRRSTRTERNPLLGIPVSLKDNIWTRGIRTTAGSKILRDFVPAEDATVMRKLARAGAVLLGKTLLHEFAYGVTTKNEHFGPARNPWSPERIPGGSSGGSAVSIAAGLCTASVGSDTGGSLRIPAALCGVVGLKPTFGRVSVYGIVPLAPSLDHAGPLARSVEDVAILLAAIAGRDDRDPTSLHRPVEDFRGALRKPIRKFRLGRSKEYFWKELDGEVRRLEEVAVHDLELAGAMVQEVLLPGLSDSIEPATHIALAEARHFHESSGLYPARSAEYSADIRQRLDAGGKVLAVDYLEARDVQGRLRAEFDDVLRDVDAIVAPTVPVPAPPIGVERIRVGEEELDLRSALLRFNRPANFTGHPAISIPCGFTRDGLPVGLQLIGRAFDEATLLRIALAYERAHGWTSYRPPID